ncbi:MAG: hypothetical protein Q8Q60_04135 [Candidatus Chromulinivorax sp.]|nr:hypothetical protein [Candidatus Chromulinivorax sp.]
MKRFIINVKNKVLFVCLATTAIFGYQSEPSSTLAAYSNKISQIAYSAGSHDQYAITFFCQKDPICIYTPLRYEDSDSSSLTKTYFLPRTQCADPEMRYFYEDIHDALQLIGIDVQIENLKGLNYGVRISFTMQSDNAYGITKIVDADKKTVSFNIVAKF